MPTLHLMCSALADAYRRYDAACEAEDLRGQDQILVEIDTARTQLALLSWSSMSPARHQEVQRKLERLQASTPAQT